MAEITLKGSPIHTNGDLPAVGSACPSFTLVDTNLENVQLASFKGTRLLNVFPSVDTPVCAMSVRTFNEKASSTEGVTVLNISADLPFAHKRFCGAEGLTGVVSLSCFRSTFAEDYGLKIVDGPLAGLCSRAVLILDGAGKLVYAEQVPEIGQEPDYDSALAVLSRS